MRNFNDPTIKREDLTSMTILPSAARNAPSMARIAILTASLAYIAILAASLAALFRQYQLGAVPAASFWQHQLGNTKAIKELQVSRAKTKPPA